LFDENYFLAFVFDINLILTFTQRKTRNMTNLNDVQKYLQNKQVYFRVEITDSDFKTIAEAGKAHEIGSVEVTRLNERTIAFKLVINSKEVSIYEYKTDEEFVKWVKAFLIPVHELVDNYLNKTT
jgi:hypothetical protein